MAKKPYKILCIECVKEKPQSDFTLHGGSVCDTCFRKTHEQCEQCEEWVEIGVLDDSNECPDCRDANEEEAE